MTSPAVPALIALAAALSYATGAVLQQRGAYQPGADVGTGPALSVPAMMKSSVWLAGLGMDAAGFGLEFLALRGSSVTLVQPLLVCGLLFALPLGARLARCPVRRSDLAAGGLVVAGLVAFLIAAQPVEGAGAVPVARWVMVTSTVAVVAFALVLAARGRRPAARALSLGAAAGLVNGVFAGLAKAVGTELDRGWRSVATSWQLVALAVAAAATLTLAAKAFQVGSPAAAVTGLFAVEPLAGIGVGAAVFGDSIRREPVFLLAEVLGMAVCLVGVSILGRSPGVVAAYGGHDDRGTVQLAPK